MYNRPYKRQSKMADKFDRIGSGPKKLELIQSDPRHDQIRDSLIHPQFCEGCG